MTNVFPGGDMIAVNSVALLPPPAGGGGSLAAHVTGFRSPGDGGGGLFWWVPTIPSSSADGILVVQPAGVTTGAWVRQFDGPINVKWGGAYGDGIHDDTAAIQAVLNLNMPPTQNPSTTKTTTVFMPSGVYNVTAPASAPALSINKSIVLLGVGSGFIDEATRIACSGVDPTVGGSAALAVEGLNAGAAGSKISGILFAGRGANLCQDLLVLHASNVTVDSCGFADCWRYGICGSSGTTGTGALDSAIGMSSMPGNAVNAHFAQILNCYAISCGDIAVTLGGGETGCKVQCTANFIQPAIGASVTVQVNTTSPFTWDGQNPHPNGILQLGIFGHDMYELVGVPDSTHITITNVGAADSGAATLTTPGASFGNGLWFNIGAGLIVYGVDANGWNVFGFNSGNCCNGTINFPQGGSTYTACYAQGTYYSHIDSCAGISTYVGCNQESVAQCILELSSQILVVGGSCATTLKGGGNNYPGRIGPSSSYVSFAQTGADGALYRFQPISYASDCAFFFNRVAPGQGVPGSPAQAWTFGYQTFDSPPPWGAPFQAQSWSFYGGALNGSFAPLGWTDSQNPRGFGCAFASNPTMNTPLHFTWKQAVTLAPGANTVYLNGGVGVNGAAVPFLNDPTIIQMDPTVYSTGTSPPQVTFTGTPTETLAPLEVDITGGGTTFTWKIGGITQATGVAIAPTVALSGTGITANFPTATYSNQTYTAYSQWGNARRKFDIALEFAATDLPTANCAVVGYSFVSNGGVTYNAAAQVQNNAGSSVNVTLVWTYDVFVTNYDSGSIG